MDTSSPSSGWAPIRPKESGLDSTRVLGVEEGTVYKLQSKLEVRFKWILHHVSKSVTEVKE